MSVTIVREGVGLAGTFSQSRLTLLAEFQLLVAGTLVRVPHSVERVLAFLGVSHTPVSRTRLAASLWPDVHDRRANGDLRSALWRLRRITGVIHEENHRLSLLPQVAVDLTEMAGLSRLLTVKPEAPDLDRVPELVQAQAILPGWDDEWLVVERERYRLSRLRALEHSADALLARGLLSEALDAALAAIDTEPYRESAHRLKVRIHIAEGNHAEAIRAYQSYLSTVSDELGIGPSPLMAELVAPLRPELPLAATGLSRR
jgi:DNA-binding SARP family transcriptional activator